jgi:Flp pilus assembly protein TadD
VLVGPIPSVVFYADARALFERGVAQFKAGDLEGAEVSLRAAREAEPNNVAVLANLGVVLAQRGKFEAAVEVYQQALKVNPRAHRLHLNLGIAHFKRNDFAAAIASLEQFRRADAEDSQGRELLALSYMQAGRFADAKGMLSALIASHGEKLPYLYALGQAQIKAGDTAGGEQTFRRMFELFPDEPETHLLRAQALMAGNQHEAALQEIAAAERPGRPVAGLNLWKAIALEGVGRSDEARAAYQKEIALTRDPLAYYGVGILEFKSGTAEAAIPLLMAALPIDSAAYNVSYFLARTYLKLGDAAKALPFAERSLTRNPESAPDHNLLLAIYRRLGRTADVKKQAEVIRGLQEKSVKKDREILERNSRPSP